jgi:hypothetical protein
MLHHSLCSLAPLFRSFYLFAYLPTLHRSLLSPLPCPLALQGEEYAKALAKYAEEHICKGGQKARLWTSSLRRTISE